MGRLLRTTSFLGEKVQHKKPWSNPWDGVELGLTPVSGKPAGFTSQGMAEWVLGALSAPHRPLQAPACPGGLRSGHPANPKEGVKI